MKNSIVTHAEWNPDNEIIAYVAPVNNDGAIIGVKERIVIEKIEEDQATPSNVKQLLSLKGYNIVKNFSID